MISWDTYAARFRAAAKAADHRRKLDDAYVDRCLAYAHRLHTKRLPIIYDAQHLALLVGYDVEYLLGAANSPAKFYRVFSIPKVTGGTRTISEPLPSLKEIQRWILDNILAPLPVHRFAKGFIRGRSIRDNARFHRGQPFVLTIDIQDFFGSIGFPRVYQIFRGLGYSKPVAGLLSKLCLLHNKLPQGAPTSPALSNQIAARIDKRLSGFAVKRRIRYTRYADDLTFSGGFKPGEVVELVRRVLRDSGLTLNESKTRLMRRHERQETTGIVVNEKLQATRKLRRSLRQAVYYIEKYGLDSHLERVNIMRANYLRHLLGLIGFVTFVNPSDEKAKRELSAMAQRLALSRLT